MRAVKHSNGSRFLIMPYTGADDANLPDNVKKLPAKKRRQWVDIFNSAYKSCIDNGGTQKSCEPSAFAQANGVLKKEESRMPNILDVIKKFIGHTIKSVNTWNGAASQYADADAYCNACLIDVNAAAGKDPKTEAYCMLPIREPGDAASVYVDKAVHAAAGGHGITQVKKPSDVPQADWDKAVKAAANKIISAYSAMNEVAPDAVYKLAGKTPPTNRSTSIGSIFEQIWGIASEKDPMAWVNDLIVEDDGSIAAIISSAGKLFKAPVTITNGTPSLGDWIEVKIDYPVVAQTRTTIQRQKDGKVRWLSVSSSTVLNRSGQIDSKKLFDSFIAHIDTTGEYPVRRFCHCYSDEFITGQCDFVARDENLLITSGVYNDTDLAKIEIAAREADPGYWGESIGFQADKAQMVELAEGISIPVFDSGVLLETSTVPEKYAAAWFTNTTQFTEEVKNMLEARAKEALVKLFNGDEDAANKWLADNVDEKNRMIASSGMITRTTEVVEAPVDEPVAPATDEVVEQAIEPPEVPVMELDDAALDAIAAKVVERQAASTTDLQALKDVVTALDARVKALEDKQNPPAKAPAPAQTPAQTQMVVNALSEIEKRLKALELDEEAKKNIWLEDAPPKPTVRITHRPRSEDAEVLTVKPDTYADIASETLAKLPFK